MARVRPSNPPPRPLPRKSMGNIDGRCRAKAVVPLPGGRSIPVEFNDLPARPLLDLVRECDYCGRHGDRTHACEGCGASSWGWLPGGIVSDPGPFFIHGCVVPKPTQGEPSPS